MRRFLLFVAGLMLGGGALLEAQVTTRPRLIRADGQATVSVKPDQVQVDFGVTKQGATAQEAATQNAAAVEKVLNALRQVLGPSADVQTVSYTLTPTYNYPQGGGQPTLTGYMANNTVEVTTQDLSAPGKLIDAAIQAGATNVQALRFGLKDDEPVRSQALAAATKQAMNHAQAIANGLGAHIGAVLSAVEGTTPIVQPLTVTSVAGGAATPIVTGMVKVLATVTVEVELI